MPSIRLSAFIASTLAAAGIPNATAAVLASYTTDSVTSSFDSSGQIAGSNPTPLFTDMNAGGRMTDGGSYIQVRADGFQGETNQPSATAADQRFLWSISAESGSTIQLESITWSFGAISTNTFTSRGNSIVYVATDIGFANIIATSTIGTVQDNGTDEGSGVTFDDFTFTTDLGGNTYETLYFGMGVTSFSTTNNGTKSLGFESIVVNGAIVPEPSVALLGLAGFGLLIRRTRRR